jgi:small-conductance mechanosensitive channel
LFLQILMAASFLIAGYQDVRERLVSDLVWIPAIIGVVLAFYFVPSQDLYLLVRIAIIGAIAFGVTWYGLVGQADGIAFVLVVADPTPLAPLPVLFAIAAVALAHIGYLYVAGLTGKDKVISLQQFKSEARWIPRAIIIGGERRDVDKDVNVSREDVEKVTDETAMVDVQYGVPTVAYIAAGYIIYVVYLAIFQTSVLTSLP